MRQVRKMLSWAWGLVRAPYPTAEAIAADGDFLPGLLLFLLATGGAMAVHSGALAALAYGRAWQVPYFIQQCGMDLVGLLLGTTAIYAAIGLCGGETAWTRVLAFWSFSYLPTALFFGGGLLGLIVFTRLFGGLDLVPQPIFLLGWFFAALMFLWKVWLLLTTLRVVGNLTLPGVVKACLLLAAGLFLYWCALRALGWQRIPYI